MTRLAAYLTEPPLLALAQPLLARCDPSPTALLDWLRPQLDDALLDVIARADRGCESEEYLVHLRRLRDEDDPDPKHAYQALEVLQLTRWSEPDHPREEERRGRRGHLGRIFCCAVLLRAAADPGMPYCDVGQGENQTIIQFIASALALGQEASAASLRLLAWRAGSLTDEEDEYPFLALGILLLATTLDGGEDGGSWLRQLADWVVAVEAVVFSRRELRDRRQPWLWVENPAWLLGLTHFTQRHETWRAVTWSVLVEPPTPPPAAAAAALRGIAERPI